MSTTKMIIVLAASVLLMTACASPNPVSHFRLEPIPTNGAFPDGPVVGLRPLKTPEYVTRSALVWQLRPHELHVDNNQRWAEPLPDSLYQVIALNLASLIPTNQIQFHPWHHKERPTIIVTITIMELLANTREATLIAETTLSNDQGVLSKRLNTWRVPIEGPLGGSSVAKAYSQLAETLSESTARQINASLKPAAGT